MITMEALNTAHFEPVKFSEIVAGDIIAHYAEDYYMESLLWVGKVEKFSKVGSEWYGNFRLHASRSIFDDNLGINTIGTGWTKVNLDNREEIIIVAAWHEKEPGHGIYRMTTSTPKIPIVDKKIYISVKQGCNKLKKLLLSK